MRFDIIKNKKYLPGGRWRCGSTGISPLVHIKLLPLRDPWRGCG